MTFVPFVAKNIRALFVAVSDTAFCEVVWRELDIDAVAHQDANAVAAHTA